MSTNPKSVDFHQCHAKRHSIWFFYHNIKDDDRNLCQDLLTIENTDSDLKVHALHYANELLVRFKNFPKLAAQHAETIRKNVWEKSCDAYSLSIRVQTPTNHISICFLPQYQRHRKCFLFRSFQSAGWKRHCAIIARHIGASSVVWLGPSNFWLVRSEHAHASYPGLFFRPPGFSP